MSINLLNTHILINTTNLLPFFFIASFASFVKLILFYCIKSEQYSIVWICDVRLFPSFFSKSLWLTWIQFNFLLAILMCSNQNNMCEWIFYKSISISVDWRINTICHRLGDNKRLDSLLVADISIKANNIVVKLVAEFTRQRQQQRKTKWQKKNQRPLHSVLKDVFIFTLAFRSKHIINSVLKHSLIDIRMSLSIFPHWFTPTCSFWCKFGSNWHFYSHRNCDRIQCLLCHSCRRKCADVCVMCRWVENAGNETWINWISYSFFLLRYTQFIVQFIVRLWKFHKYNEWRAGESWRYRFFFFFYGQNLYERTKNQWCTIEVRSM